MREGGRGGRARLLDRCVSAICTHYQQLYLAYHQPRCNGASSTFHIIIPPRPGSPRLGVWLETEGEREGERRWGQIDRMKEGVIEKWRWKGRDRGSSAKTKQWRFERKERRDYL